MPLAATPPVAATTDSPGSVTVTRLDRGGGMGDRRAIAAAPGHVRGSAREAAGGSPPCACAAGE